jgi:hypothetical protein
MPQTLTQQDLDYLFQLHFEERLIELYDYLQQRGYRYATRKRGLCPAAPAAQLFPVISARRNE